MTRRRAQLVMSLAIALGVSCVRAPTSPVRPLAPPRAKDAPGARWAFAPVELETKARLALAEGELIGSSAGRRALRDAKGAWTSASTLVRGDVVAIARDGSDYLFVTNDGSVHVSHEPLGPIGETRAGPFAVNHTLLNPALSDAAAGVKSIVELGVDGRGFRSVDGGRSWAPLALPAVSFGAGTIGLDRAGKGLALVWPQRLYATSDDAATWTRIESTGNAPSSVIFDGADRLWTASNDASLPMGLFDPQGQRVGPAGAVVYTPVAVQHEHVRAVGTPIFTGTLGVRQLARIVEQTVEARSLLVGPLGGPWTEHPLPVGAWIHDLAGFDEELWLAVDKAPGTIQLSRSIDAGKTFSSEGVFRASEDGSRLWAIGPAGYVVILACPVAEKAKCETPFVRSEVTKAFSPLPLPAGFGPAEHVAIDRVRSRLWLVDHHGRIAMAPLVGGPLVVMTKDDDAKGDEVTKKKNDNDDDDTSDGGAHFRIDRLQLGDDGAAVVFDRSVLRHVDENGVFGAPLTLPLDMPVQVGGKRGLLPGPWLAWETNDGGLRWGPVTTPNQFGGFVCGMPGCVFGVADRVGWDEPPARSQPPQPFSYERRLVPAPLAGSTPISANVRCELVGVPHDLVERPSWIEEPRMHWGGFTETANGVVTEVAGALDGKTTTTQLLGARPAAKSHLVRTLRRPPLVARFVYDGEPASGFGYDVIAQGAWQGELAWVAPETGKVVRHALDGTDLRLRLPKALPGGVLFDDETHVRLFASDGSTRASPFLPGSIVVRSGDAFLALDAGGGRLVTWDGKVAPPKVIAWNVGPFSALVGGTKPFARFSNYVDDAVLPLTPFGVDPPEPHRVGPNAAGLRRCAEGDEGLLFSEPLPSDSVVRIEIAGKPLPRIFSTADALLLLRSDGTTCLRGFARDELLLAYGTKSLGGALVMLAKPMMEAGEVQYRTQALVCTD